MTMGSGAVAGVGDGALHVGRDEAVIEAEIKAKGLTAPRLTPRHIDDQIVAEYFHVVPDSTVTICALTCRNGFVLVGHSAAASSANFDEILGRKIARQNAREKLWQLEGYLLRSKLALGGV